MTQTLPLRCLPELGFLLLFSLYSIQFWYSTVKASTQRFFFRPFSLVPMKQAHMEDGIKV